jgi:hypothetical protein
VASSRAFEWICTELETITALNKLEARGTIRLALKEAGLEAARVTPLQMSVVLERILPGELRSRGMKNADEICGSLASALRNLPIPEEGDVEETPEQVFGRLSR